MDVVAGATAPKLPLPTGAGQEGRRVSLDKSITAARTASADAAPGPSAGELSTRALLSNGDVDALLDRSRPSEAGAGRDVEFQVRIELGRSNIALEDLPKLDAGSVVELDKLAGDPVDVFVGDRRVAQGEALILHGNLCVLVNQLGSFAEEEL